VISAELRACGDPDLTIESRGIAFYSAPWAYGFAATTFYGPIQSETIFVGPSVSWADAIDRALLELATETARLGGNAVMGFILTFLPFDNPPRMLAVGTAVRIRPIY